MNSGAVMKAVVVHGPGDYRLEEAPIPAVGTGELLIRVEACGICASDIKTYHGAPKIWGGDGNPPYIQTPVVAGHEFIGEVVELGPDYSGEFRVGDRVISEQIVPCWNCRYCNTGKYWMCQKHDIYGFRPNVNGAMAQYMKFSKDALVYRVPRELSLEQAVLIEPYACSKHAVDRGSIGPDDTVVVAGAGTLGLGMVGAIHMLKPKTLVVLDLKEDRLELAKRFGADVAINPGTADPVQAVLDLTDGYGCDVYIEATGHPASVKQGLEMIRKLGRFVEFSVFKDPVTVDWSIIGDSKELDIYGAHLGPYCYTPVIDAIANGSMPTDGVVTHRFPLEQWKEAFEVMERGDGSIKVILIP
ncbi:alcohol dehydrogenase catalytic domain-containing protein [Paenibacillus thalictri]|uniref:Erythritol/L-threitol dehydrogenase n=1 Tax=Paenibacillus thalictri TaxID=2527873 RepID=A0A4Q9DJR3_9BACL|nr:alcohol dehydrogenase catalytic domain-containing protein [Paenibacillus thalictri]TBL74639.1 erythritol/L-threitol dehydrogenase [Paenibacillus thalictri]